MLNYYFFIFLATLDFVLAVFVLWPAFGLSQLSRQLLIFVIVFWLWSVLLLALVILCLRLEGSTLIQLLSRIEAFPEVEDMEVMDFGYCYFWIWIYTRYVLLILFFGWFFEWLCEEILTIGSRDITKLIRRINFVFWNLYIILFTYLKVVIVANPKYSVCCPNVFHSLFCNSLGVSW